MKLFFSYRKTFDKLSDEDAGQLIKAMLLYGDTGEAIPPESPMADLVFDFIKAQIDKDRKAFVDGGKGGRPRKETTETETENPPSENQKPPFPETETGVSENENPPSEKPKPYKGIKDQRIKGVINTTTTSAGACAREETPFGTVDIDPLIIKAQRELLGLTDTHYDLLRQYREALGDELVSYAIDSAVANGVRKWAYVESILSRFESAGIKTVAEAKAADEKRKAQPKGRDAPKTVTAQRFPQRQYEDKALEDQVFGDFLRAAGVK